jgi:catechol-2,3-dioxygenase
MHLFFRLDDGNFIAFFDEPDISTEQHFARKDSFDVHIAFATDNLQELLRWQQYISHQGKTCLGPIDHGFVSSVYMYDPNGLQVEITCENSEYQQIIRAESESAHESIKQWTEKTRTLKEQRFSSVAIDKRGSTFYER